MEALVDIGQLLTQIPREVLLVGHCLFVANTFKSTRKNFLLNYWVGLLCAFGGGMSSALLLQDPDKTPIPVFTVNAMFIIWSISWWIINYSPLGLGVKAFSLVPVKLLCRIGVNILRTTTMVSRVDAAVVRYPGNLAAPLVIGALGGCGGKFLSDALLIAAGQSEGPSELASPGFSWRSATLAALVHYACAYFFSVLKPLDSKAALVCVFVAHGALVDLIGRPLDFTAPLAGFLHTFLNIPLPQDRKQPIASGRDQDSKKMQ